LVRGKITRIVRSEALGLDIHFRVFAALDDDWKHREAENAKAKGGKSATRR